MAVGMAGIWGAGTAFCAADTIFFQTALGNPNVIRTFDAGTGAPVGALGSFAGLETGSKASLFRFGSDGCLYGLGHGIIWKYDFFTSTFSTVVDYSDLPDSNFLPNGFAVALDGNLILRLAGAPAKEMRVYNPSSGLQIGSYGVLPDGPGGSAQGNLVFGPDGRLYGTGNSVIWSFDTSTSSYGVVFDYSGLPNGNFAPNGFTVSPDGQLILRLAGLGTEAVRIIDPTTGTQSGSFIASNGGSSGAGMFVFGPDGQLYGLGDGVIWKYNLITATLTTVLDYSSFPDGNFIPAGFTVSAIPEPSALPLLLLMLLIPVMSRTVPYPAALPLNRRRLHQLYGLRPTRRKA